MPLVGTGFVVESLISETATYRRHAIHYKSNGLMISGILNMPKGEGPFPLAVLNHGYIDPKVYTRGRGLKREQDYLASHGFSVLHSDYRGHAEGDPSPDAERRAYDAGLEYSMDVVNGVRALCATDLPINCDDVTMMGHSMGGGVTMNIAVAYPDVADRIVLYAPVSAKAWNNFDRWRRERDTDDRTLEVYGSDDPEAEAWIAASTWPLLNRITVPVLVAYGNRDADVPKAWSDELVTRLKELNKNVTYLEFPDEPHEFINRWPEFMRTVVEFAE